MLRAGLITTLNTNVGDDLIRLGIKRILSEIYSGESISWVEINKHDPGSAFKSPLSQGITRLVQRSPRGRWKLQKLVNPVVNGLSSSYFDDCDLIAQCGAPVYWTNCHQAEWAMPLWYGVADKLSKRMPVFNLAAGSCFPWNEREDPSMSEEDKRYIVDIHRICRLTTVRDLLSEKILHDLGVDSERVPCSALVSATADEARHLSQNGTGRMLVNYMRGAGHYAFGQPIDPDKWSAIFREVVERFKKEYEIVFICHNQKEIADSKEIDPHSKTILVPSADEYHATIPPAEVALCNRMHASVAMASAGIPSVAIGTDTRLMMVQNMEIPAYFVNDVTADSLEADLRRLIAGREAEKQRLLTLKQQTFDRYLELVKPLVPQSSAK